MPKNKSIAVMPLIIALCCVGVIFINPEVNVENIFAALYTLAILSILLYFEFKQKIKL